MILHFGVRLLIAALLLCVAQTVAAQDGTDDPAGRRVALVIAVEGYGRLGPSPAADARGARLAEGLAALGFTVETPRGGRDAAIRAAIRRFAVEARAAEAAVVVLAGHLVSARGESFLLPANAMVERASDLLSRGVSVSSLAALAGQAAQGAVVLALATSPDLSSTVPDVAARPTHDRPAPPRVALAFSSSPRTPVSAVTGAAAAAFDRLEAALAAPIVTTATLAEAVGASGMTLGDHAAVLLRAPQRKPAPETAPDPARALPPAAPAAEAAPIPPVSEAALDLPVAGAASTVRAAEASPAAPEQAQAAEPVVDAATREADAPMAGPAAAAATRQDGVPIDALELIESMLAAPKKRLIQSRLRDRGHYAGAIDAAFGPRTRAAIVAFQEALGDPPTGFLTPAQIEALLAP